MIQRGTLDNVTAIPAGTFLAADVAAGVTVLPVDWTAEFDEFGGLLGLNDLMLPYVEANEDASTITLADPLAAPAESGDEVLSLSLAGEQRNKITAFVQIDEGEDPVPHEVPSSLEGRLTETTPAGTLVQVDTSTRLVVGADDVSAPVDGALVWNPYLARRMTSVLVPDNTWFTPSAWADSISQAVTSTTTNVVVDVRGFYAIDAQVAWATNGSGRRFIQILVNGVAVGVDAGAADPDSSSYNSCFGREVLEVGDVVEIQIKQTSGAALFISAGVGRCRTSLYRVSV